MSLHDAAAVLERLAHRVWWTQVLHQVALSLAVALTVTIGAGGVFGWSPSVQVAVGAVLLAAGLGAGLAWVRRKGIDAALIAAHLDRTVPALEESTGLLLRPSESLRLLERLQQRRALEAFSRLSRPLRVPHDGLYRAASLVALALSVGLVLAAWMPRLSSDGPVHAEPVPLHAVGPDSASASMPLQMVESRVTVRPPAYLGRPPVTFGHLTLEAPRQAQAVWTIRFNQPVVQAHLLFSYGDTLILHLKNADAFQATGQLHYAGFYFLEATSGDGLRLRSDYYAVSVVEDRPPVLTVVRPEPRTLIAPDAPRHVDLDVFAADDYGLQGVQLVATVSKGSGENVKFREQVLDFDTVEAASDTLWTLGKTLDLDALGMEMGDELFFFIEGWDRHTPEPNRGRSETFFVVLQDTSRWADASGFSLALNPTEEYLRSQRQIIIDTEKLVADAATLRREVFNQRSNAIGIDQKLLRLRYGQFLGEAFVSTVTQAEQTAPGFAEVHEDESGLADPAADQHDAMDGVAVETNLDAAREIIEQYAHMHDTEEGATFYAEDIKRALKAALAEMWESELHLRTYRPKEALPYQYRALRILKALQQEARIYVKRIGFEPPPLKPDEARLTGKLDAVLSRASAQDVEPEVPFPAIRAVLAMDRSMEQASRRDVIRLLERAGQELASIAVEEAGRYLPALQALRTLIDDLEAGRGVCRACFATVERAFWHVMPPADAVPTQRRDGGTSLARSYFNHLER